MISSAVPVSTSATRIGSYSSGAAARSAGVMCGASQRFTKSMCPTASNRPERAAAVNRLFAELPNVRVFHGDWHDVLLPEAPFDLLFFAVDSLPGTVPVAVALAILSCRSPRA